MNIPPELLRSAAIADMKGNTKAHLLNPEAIRTSKSLGAATGLKDLGFHIYTVMPGREYSEYHRHLYEEQCFYVLSGSGEVTIDERKYAIEAGDFIGFPKNGAAHTILNNSNDTLTFICARINLEQDICEYPRKMKRLYMNGAEEVLVNIQDIRIEHP